MFWPIPSRHDFICLQYSGCSRMISDNALKPSQMALSYQAAQSDFGFHTTAWWMMVSAVLQQGVCAIMSEERQWQA